MTGSAKILSLRDAKQTFARCICEMEAGEAFIINRIPVPRAKEHLQYV